MQWTATCSIVFSGSSTKCTDAQESKCQERTRSTVLQRCVRRGAECAATKCSTTARSATAS